MLNDDQKEKKPRITELVSVISVIVTILIAGTSLLSSSENVPEWWFLFSFIFLVALTFVIPSVIFAKPISRKIKNYRLKKKQNAIAREHFSRFQDLVDTAKRFASPIGSVSNSLRTHYHNTIKSELALRVLQSYSEVGIQNKFFEIEERLKESDKTFRDLYLIMKHFEFSLNAYIRQLKIIEVFAHEMMFHAGKPVAIAKGIEDEFEAFREKFNDFVKDFKDYCRIVNKELGEIKFPEGAIDRIKKW